MKDTNSRSPKLMFVVNVDWFFLSHRLPIALAAITQGYKVIVVANDTGKGKEIESYGIKFINLPILRSGRNPFKEINTVKYLYKLYRECQPSIIHHVTLKLVAYGAIAAKLNNIPVVNAISGLGYVFTKQGKISIEKIIIKKLLKYGFKNPNYKLILQNNDDYSMFSEQKILADKNIFLIKGSGVDCKQFRYSLEPQDGELNVVLPARTLWDKGIAEFVKASRILREKGYSNVRFIIVGMNDKDNPAVIPETTLRNWENEKIIEWWGHQSNMVDVLTNSSIVVLPSYREGLPKSLIEACAIGRPIVTTDVPGCREVVKDQINGFLVPPRNAEKLAVCIEKLLNNKDLRYRMGLQGRKMAEAEFSIENVIDSTLLIYQELMKERVTNTLMKSKIISFKEQEA